MYRFKQKISIPISILSIAIISLSLSIFQAKVSESNQTSRQASFEILKKLNHLQFIIDKEYYGTQDKERYLDGWLDVMLISDLAIFTTEQVTMDVKALFLLWKKDSQNFHTDISNKELSKIIKKTRQSLKLGIEALN